MRILDPTLAAALTSGQYTPYFNITIFDNYTLEEYANTTPVGYKLNNLSLTVKIQVASYLSIPQYKTSLVLTRGVTILGINFTLETSKFSIINSTWDGNFQTFNCHLIPQNYYTAAGDLTYQEVIEEFCTTFGKTAVFLDPTATWLDWRFLPTGKAVTFSNAHNFFTLLRQKYFIFATDNGNDEILFYAAFQHVADPQYSIQGYHYKVDYNIDRMRQYIWRDEIETLHTTNPTFDFTQQLGTEKGTSSLLDLDNGTILAGTSTKALLYKSSNYGDTWTIKSFPVADYGLIYSLVSLGNGIVLAGTNFWPDETNSQGNLYKSIDYGETWTLLRNFGTGTITTITNLGNGILLLSYTVDGPGHAFIYRSVDYGATWTQVKELTENYVWSMIYCGVGIVLAGTQPTGQIWKSEDYGSSWSLIGQLGIATAVLSLLVLENGIVLAGTKGTIDPITCKLYKSLNYGETWTLAATFSETRIYSLITIGNGIILAGTQPGGNVYISIDSGDSWSLVQQLGAETEVRSFIALKNGTTLAGTGGTGSSAKIYKSLNCGCSLALIHNLGFMPSTASEPNAYSQLAPPKFDPFPVHLKYQSSDFIQVLLQPTGTYNLTCADVVEELDLSKKELPWRITLEDTEWLSNTDGGPLPGTIMQVAAYTPLVVTNFDKNLNTSVNNLQALADKVDELTTGPAIYAATNKTTPNDNDLFGLVDSNTSTHLVRKLSWANLKAHAGGEGGGGIEEAPTDGTPYSRQDEDWVPSPTSDFDPADLLNSIQRSWLL
jgi:photosystem II stability/assembly factor-like uncharacterized protein